MKKYLLEADNMTETIKNWVNICVLKNQEILLLNRKHDNFPGWIPPGGKVEFPESFFEAALRELKEETGLTALNLELKGISGFTNSIGNERFVFYDFLCTQFTGELSTSAEGEPKWWNLKDIDKIPMQDEIRKRLPLYLRKGSFESINYWDDNKKCISENKTILFD